MNALHKPSLQAFGPVTNILKVENGQKLDEFEPVYVGNYRYWCKLFVIFEHTINRLSFGYARFASTWILFFLFCFFFLPFFFFFLIVFAYTLWHPKRIVFNFWPNEDIREDFCATEIKDARLESPLNRVLQAFELLNRFRWMDQIFGMVRC